ncbi:MAG: hypothetical protein ABR500_04025 [Dermatophilaceae bacterium]
MRAEGLAPLADFAVAFVAVAFVGGTFFGVAFVAAVFLGAAAFFVPDALVAAIVPALPFTGPMKTPPSRRFRRYGVSAC